MIAGPRESEVEWLGVGLVDIGTFSLTWLAVDAGAEAGLGGYSSSLRLFHIKDHLLHCSIRMIAMLHIIRMQLSYYALERLSFGCHGENIRRLKMFWNWIVV